MENKGVICKDCKFLKISGHHYICGISQIPVMDGVRKYWQGENCYEKNKNNDCKEFKKGNILRRLYNHYSMS